MGTYETSLYVHETEDQIFEKFMMCVCVCVCVCVYVCMYVTNHKNMFQDGYEVSLAVRRHKIYTEH